MWKVAAEQTNMATVHRSAQLKRRCLWKSLTSGKQLLIFLQLPALFSTRVSQDRCGFCASLLHELAGSSFLAPLSTADQGIVVVPRALALHGKMLLLLCVLSFFSLPPGLFGEKKKKRVKIQFLSFLSVPVCFQHLRGSLHGTHSTGEVYGSSFSFSQLVFQRRCLKMPI